MVKLQVAIAPDRVDFQEFLQTSPRTPTLRLRSADESTSLAEVQAAIQAALAEPCLVSTQRIQ
jgi:hypothetical protein